MYKLRFVLSALGGICCLGQCSAVSFSITKVYTVKHAVGGDVPYTPLVGETYSVGVDYTQTGAATKPYLIKFRLADRTSVVTVNDLTPGDKHFTADFTVPLDGEIDIAAEIDSVIALANAHGPMKTATFTPVPPSDALEFYDPVQLRVQQTMSYPIQATGKYGFDFLAGCPVTDGWQTSLTSNCKVNGVNVPIVKMDYPVLFPLYYYAGSYLNVKQINTDEICEVRVNNQRVNPDKLRKVTWAAMDALTGIDVFKHFTQPEAVIQSNDPVIKQFVETALGGSNYRSKYNPYDACRKVFQAVVAHCHYFYPKPGYYDNRAQNAVQMVQTGIGDCGSFSMLLVACYRHMGIPARDACGAWIGTDSGHCWSEMWFPSAGWIVTDGSLSQITSGSGKYAYYFGYIPDLNARYAMMRGNTFIYANASTSWLQGPMWQPILTNCQFSATVTGHTYVTEMIGNPLGKLVRAQAASKLPAWNVNEIQRVSGKFLLKPLPKP